MEGPRPPVAEEIPEVLSFVDSQLREQEGWSIKDEYPQAFHSTNLKNLRIIRDQNGVQAHAVMKFSLTKTPVGLFKAAAIGSVVTAPEARGQGYSRMIIENCVQEATQQGCDFAILWSDLFDFYQKFGFALAGKEIHLILDKELNLSLPEDLRFVAGNQVSPEALLKLYTQHRVGSIRTPEDMRNYLKIPNSHLYTLWSAQNQLLAYAVEGKGADLKHHIHEWGGGVQELMWLFAEIRRQAGHSLTVLAPEHSQNLIRQMQAQGARIQEGWLGLLKILNPQNVLGKVHRYARTLGIADLVFEQNSEGFILGFHNNLFQINSTTDALRLLFGPYRASDFKALDPETVKTLEELLPLPLWFWGWDSV